MQTGLSKPIDRYIPWMFVAVFALLFAVLGWFTWLALSTFDGVVSKTPYETGLAYDRVVEASNRQDALGWTVSARLSGGNRLVVIARDSADQPVSINSIAVRLQRPTTDRYDRVLTLRQTAPGRFEAPVSLPLAGAWDAILIAQSPHGPYHVRRRLLL